MDKGEAWGMKNSVDTANKDKDETEQGKPRGEKEKIVYGRRRSTFSTTLDEVQSGHDSRHLDS